jgi:hypothetical protein
MLKPGDKAIFESPWYLNVPEKIVPVYEMDELYIIENFIQEVNSKFMTDLAAECVVSRDAENESEDEATRTGGKTTGHGWGQPLGKNCQ